jgi:hypothetical protein
MPKLNPAPISEKDLEAYLASESDFAFEMKVLSLLRKLGFTCSHAGTYEDPITQKIRQYDLRAEKVHGNFKLALAVECKNLRPNFPLLISAVPRTVDEAFHEIVVFRAATITEMRDVHYVGRGQSRYRLGEMVGKRTDQVGRAEHNSELFSDDGATFDKMSQAINSSKDIFIESAWESAPPFLRVIVPVLVVPANVLWQVDYDRDGNITKHPYHVDETTLFIDHLWSALVGIQTLNYRISHLHIVTLSYFEQALELWMGPKGFFSTTN